MKSAAPVPRRRSASSTLTAAMMPSNRFLVAGVVSRCWRLDRGCLMRSLVARLRRVFAEDFVQKVQALAGHAGNLAGRDAKTAELAGEVVERRLQPPPQTAAL